MTDVRAVARAWLRTLGRRPKERVRISLTAETAAIVCQYMADLARQPGDGFEAVERVHYLLGFAVVHGSAKERPKQFSPYCGRKRLEEPEGETTIVVDCGDRALATWRDEHEERVIAWVGPAPLRQVRSAISISREEEAALLAELDQKEDRCQ